MAKQDERPGRARNTQRPEGQVGLQGERVRGRPGVVAPPDPPLVPEVTDAEAAGTPPGAASRAEAPDSGPRTPQSYQSPPSRTTWMERPVVTGLLIVLVLIVLALVLF